MKRVSGLLRRLQWKFTFSYALITIAALLLVELIAAIFILQAASTSGTQLLPGLVQEKSLQASTYFLHI